MNLADHALRLAERGLAVIPLKACEKVPATKRGFKDATTDAGTIRGWWEGWPEQNIGVATGERSGVWVLDVDGDGGEVSLAKLCRMHGPLPATVQSITGKGRHIWFRYPADMAVGSTAKRLGPGLDTRGNDGYVVVPPSIHPDGRTYEWSIDSGKDFADAPDWLLELLRPVPKAANGHLNGSKTAGAQLPPLIQAAVQTAVEHGKRSEHSFAIMCQLFELGLADWDVQAIADGAPFAEKFWRRGDLLEEITRARARWALKPHKPGRPPEPFADLGNAAPKPIPLPEFLGMEFPPREMVLSPIIPAKGLVMLYARRGIGKTHTALGCSCAVAAGKSFLRWDAPEPRRVLHIDGEMPASALQERLRWTMNGGTPPETLEILSSDAAEVSFNLTTAESQAYIDSLLNGVSLLVLDNLSSLSNVAENDAEGWGPIQDWLLRLRRRGIAVLIIHHGGKSGEQRGTSRREDVLDTSIALVHPTDYKAEEGARFEVHYKKARGIFGQDVAPFEAQLSVEGRTAVWTMRDLETVNEKRVEKGVRDGMSVREIAEATGLPKSTVHDIKKRLENKQLAEAHERRWGHDA